MLYLLGGVGPLFLVLAAWNPSWVSYPHYAWSCGSMSVGRAKSLQFPLVKKGF